MALFTNTYSGLITGGLGGPACCGLLTMGFGVFFCKIEVTPVVGGGGGGSYSNHPNIYQTVKGQNRKRKTKTVQIVVKFGPKRVWRHSYNVDEQKASLTVKVIDMIHVAGSKFNIGIDHIQHAAKKVTAVFKR